MEVFFLTKVTFLLTGLNFDGFINNQNCDFIYSRFDPDSDFHCSAVRFKYESRGKHSKHWWLISIQQNFIYFISFAEEIKKKT